MTSEQLVAAMRERINSYSDGTWTGPIASAYDVSILLSVIDELKASLERAITPTMYMAEIDARKAAEAEIARLKESLSRVPQEGEVSHIRDCDCHDCAERFDWARWAGEATSDD